MRFYDANAWEWNRCVAPAGNMAGLNPQRVADVCDKFGVPWYTEGSPYTSGIKALCMDDKIWKRIINLSK